MPNISSISSFEPKTAGRSAVSPFFRRIARFAGPYIAVAVVLTGLFLRSGEVLPTRFVSWLTTFQAPFVYLNDFSDHSYHFKLEASQLRRPEILVIGGSRMNQWRSAMFKPHGFFNASNCLYTQFDYRRFLEDLGDYAPRVLMFSLDFYTFNPAYDEFFKHVSYGELGGFGSAEQAQIVGSLLKRTATNPLSLWPFQREPLHGVPALGLHAARTGRGFRIDGSFQYGSVLLGHANSGAVSIDSAVERVEKGTVPFLPADHLHDSRRAELERFAAAAREKGINLVAISMPYAPQVEEALGKSEQHTIWKEFQSAKTGEWLRQQGIVYFNFSRLESFGGKAEEFVDPFHATETAYLRMLLVMLQNESIAALLPGLDRQALQQRLKAATRFEVYVNEFD